MITDRNRFEPVTSSLLLAAGVVASIVLITLILTGLGSARRLANVVIGTIDENTVYLEESGIVEYDGMTVHGADVINYCKRYGGDVRIELVYGTEPDAVVYIYNETVVLSDLRSGTGDLRIRAGGDWSCTVERNENKVITAVRYTKND